MLKKTKFSKKLNFQTISRTKPPMTEALNAPFEIWTSRQATQLLSEKHICILGDSIQRMVYKDLVKFLSTNKLCNTFELRKKAEPYFNRDFHSDRLVDSSEAHNGTHYYEIREWVSENGKIRVTFFFITRLYRMVFLNSKTQFLG